MPQTDRTWFEGALCELVANAILIPGMTWPQRYLMVELEGLLQARASETVVEPEHDHFEEWLIDRWLTHVRSPQFRTSADYHFLRAEFERQFK